MTKETCRSCRFCEKSDRQYARLECRRRPPIMVGHKSSCASWVAPGWPDVKPEHWCGEYEPASVPWANVGPYDPLERVKPRRQAGKLPTGGES